MQLLVDATRERIALLRQQYDFIGGQLLSPLTRFSSEGHVFAIDNGAFSQFNHRAFESLLKREFHRRANCLFVCVPDVVGSARRTLEVFDAWYCLMQGWPLALVCQDGQEELPIPWALLTGVFIGGTTSFKMSSAASQIIKAAQLMGVHVHVGRINTPERWKHFEQLGVDTCDGSGVSRYDWMLDRISRARSGLDYPLFDPPDVDGTGNCGNGAGDAGADVPGCDETSAIHDRKA